MAVRGGKSSATVPPAAVLLGCFLTVLRFLFRVCQTLPSLFWAMASQASPLSCPGGSDLDVSHSLCTAKRAKGSSWAKLRQHDAARCSTRRLGGGRRVNVASAPSTTIILSCLYSCRPQSGGRHASLRVRLRAMHARSLGLVCLLRRRAEPD